MSSPGTPGARTASGWRSVAGASALLVLAALPVLAACSDGYPAEDIVHIDPARMTKLQLLAALNELGEDVHPARQWRYAMREGCQLEIAPRDDAQRRQRVPLKGTTVTAQSDGGVTRLLLVPPHTASRGAITAIETHRWPDTLRARSLLDHLGARC